jgi:hypothetical protein
MNNYFKATHANVEQHSKRANNEEDQRPIRGEEIGQTNP